MSDVIKRTVWVVEDEPTIAELLVEYLRHSGHEAEHFPDGGSLVQRLRAAPPDLLLLDVMLPGRDGLSLCQEIRGFSRVPIIMLTARVEELDRIAGLEIGADDYICKPFSPREVMARVKALLRRASPTEALSPEGAPIRIDDAAHRVVVRLGPDQHVLDLTDTEFRLMRALVSQPGVILTRAQLLEHARGLDADVFDRAIDSHIKNLRRKLAAVWPEPCLHSVYGVGYRFEL